MMALGVMAQPAGNGSMESPFLLGTAEDMSWFRTYVYDTDAKACAKLTADIDLSSAGTWMGIGTEMRPYQGVFDGDGHRIKGVNMNFANVNQDNVGLFGCARYAVVKNLSVSGTAVAGMVAGGSIASGVSLLMGRGRGGDGIARKRERQHSRIRQIRGRCGRTPYLQSRDSHVG